MTTITTATFATASAGTHWITPAATDATNAACLTAGTDPTQSPVVGCDLLTPDTSGSGALQLTNGGTGEVGSAFSTIAVPASGGLDVTFDSYQYGGSDADGLAFDLAVANPADPAPPATSGPGGGALGYSAAGPGATAGLPHGYLGFGLDTYGNYFGSGVGGNSCGGPGDQSEEIAVRGPGNGLDGYCAITRNEIDSPTYTLDNSAAGARTGVVVPVEVVLNPTSEVLTAVSSGVSVPADSWLIAVQPLDNDATPGTAWSDTATVSGPRGHRD